MARDPNVVLSGAQVADYAYGAGFRGEALADAIAVADAETSFRPNITHDNAPQGGKGVDRGLWAINDYWHSEVSDAEAFDPARAAQAAYRISRGGTDWSQWSTWPKAARQFLEQARQLGAAREKLGGSGAVAGGGTAADPTPASSTTPATSTSLGTSPDVTVGKPGALSLAHQAPHAVETLLIGGADVAAYVVDGGTVDLTMDEVSQVDVPLIDIYGPGSLAGDDGPVAQGAIMHFDPFILRVAAIERTTAEGVGRVNVTGRAYNAQILRDPTPPAHPGWKNTSATEALVSATTGRVVAKGTARRADIVPATLQPGTARTRHETRETLWELFTRLGKEEGFILFEAAEVIYFGPPTWLADQGVVFRVVSPLYTFDTNLCPLDEPTSRLTLDDPAGPTTTVAFDLPRWRGEQIRPGMVADVDGREAAGRFLVSRVQWDLDAGNGPVHVEGVTPVDPVATAPGGVAPTDPTTTTPPATATEPASSSTPASTFDTSRGSDGPGSSTVYARKPRITQAERIAAFGAPGDRGRTVVLPTPWGITCVVNRAVADRFTAAVNRAHAESQWVPHRIDSYNVAQNIPGSTEWSLHSFGLAWDIFSSGPGIPPPGGVWGPTSAPDAAFREAWKKEGFYVGAEFSTRKDYPHHEWAAGLP